MYTYINTYTYTYVDNRLGAVDMALVMMNEASIRALKQNVIIGVPKPFLRTHEVLPFDPNSLLYAGNLIDMIMLVHMKVCNDFF